MTVTKNERVVLTSRLNHLIVGNHYEVANFTDTHVIIRDVKTKVAEASIHVDDFEKHFSLVSAGSFKGWTEWVAVMNPDRQAYFYRTNGKKVQVKTAEGFGEASCNVKHGDVFDLSFGVQLALIDCKLHAKSAMIGKLTQEFEQMSNKIHCLVDQVIDLNETKKKLINSYYFSSQESSNVAQ